MANILNTGSDAMTPVLRLDNAQSTQIAPKSALSKASREFRLPKESSPSVLTQKGSGRDIREGRKLPQNKFLNDSDFSTEESSDTEKEYPSLKLDSSSFYLKSQSVLANKARKLSQEHKSDVVLENAYFGSNSDARNEIPVQLQKQAGRQGHREGTSPEAGGKKPRKKYNNRKNKPKTVEGYKAKKKTELCKNWEMTRTCKFGDSCAFAHGEHELVPKNNVPSNYKTKMCKQFHEEGYCPYGNRCQFLHLAIQKDKNKFNYCDILKEGLMQYNSRCKVIGSDSLEDLLINSFKTKRLQIFEEFCPENERKVKNSDPSGNESTWAKFNSNIMGGQA